MPLLKILLWLLISLKLKARVLRKSCNMGAILHHTQASLLFKKYVKDAYTVGPLHLLFFMPGILSPLTSCGTPPVPTLDACSNAILSVNLFLLTFLTLQYPWVAAQYPILLPHLTFFQSPSCLTILLSPYGTCIILFSYLFCPCTCLSLILVCKPAEKNGFSSVLFFLMFPVLK